LEVVRPNASGSLRNAHGRKDTLFRKTRCSIFMHMIFNPFITTSGFHFNIIALFRIKCRSNVLALCAIATILLPKGDSRIDKTAFLLTDRPRTNASSYRIACSLRLPHLHTTNRTLAGRRDQVHAVFSEYPTFSVVSKS